MFSFYCYCSYFILVCKFHMQSMLLLLLSRSSHVRLCATLWTAALQAPLSTGFSRQEYWSRLPFSFSKPYWKLIGIVRRRASSAFVGILTPQKLMCRECLRAEHLSSCFVLSNSRSASKTSGKLLQGP